MLEPGLDRHEWESEWEALGPLVEDSPAEALPELDDLVARMLAERGFDLKDAVAVEGEEPEIVAELRAAREITRMYERGDDVGPGDIGAAVNGYRAIYEHLIENRSAP